MTGALVAAANANAGARRRAVNARPAARRVSSLMNLCMEALAVFVKLGHWTGDGLVDLDATLREKAFAYMCRRGLLCGEGGVVRDLLLVLVCRGC